MTDTPCTIWWVRRDLRLSDNPALRRAAAGGGPVIPVFVLDDLVGDQGAAPSFRLGLGLAHFATALEGQGSRLILRRGRARDTLRQLVAETGAGRVVWSRLYDPAARTRDAEVKSALRDDGIEAESVNGHLLFEPWTVKTGDGGFYKVFSPYWRAVRSRDPGRPLARPERLAPPQSWPRSDDLADWHLGAAMGRGAEIVARHQNVGEDRAASRLGAFIAHGIDRYAEDRDFPTRAGTSRLSENLTHGEIGPRTVWAAAMQAREDGKDSAETFLKELAWREFAYHLLYHTPHIAEANWREAWDAFPWNSDERRREVKAWKQGRTGIRFVDAAMREMYVTGHMHNRARMIVASYLTKHLMCHWRIGQKWFEDCLTDWDPASNAMGWQWAAGSGPDAAPYFRIFNPATQAEKFDPEGRYDAAWIAEGCARPTRTALDYFEAIPRSWHMSPQDPYPAPVVGLSEGRERALAAYGNRGF